MFAGAKRKITYRGYAIWNFNKIFKWGVVYFGISTVKIGRFVNAASVCYLHIYAVGIVPVFAKNTFTARYGNVGNYVIADFKA